MPSLLDVFGGSCASEFSWKPLAVIWTSSNSHYNINASRLISSHLFHTIRNLHHFLSIRNSIPKAYADIYPGLVIYRKLILKPHYKRRKDSRSPLDNEKSTKCQNPIHRYGGYWFGFGLLQSSSSSLLFSFQVPCLVSSHLIVSRTLGSACEYFGFFTTRYSLSPTLLTHTRSHHTRSTLRSFPTMLPQTRSPPAISPNHLHLSLSSSGWIRSSRMDKRQLSNLVLSWLSYLLCRALAPKFLSFFWCVRFMILSTTPTVLMNHLS